MSSPHFSPAAPLVDLADFERAARARLDPLAWDYLAGGAADEHTLRWNEEAYARLKLRPRVLVDVSQLDTTVTLLGRTHAAPLLLAPTAYQRLFHAEGELAVARGAAAAETTLVVSTSATTSLEDIAAVDAAPRWFQLYVMPDRGFTRELVQRADAAGYEALVVTVDTPVLGPRYREIRGRFALPPGLERANLRGTAHPGASLRPSEQRIYSPTLDPRLTWQDLDWLRSLTRRPIVLKGILNPDDADRAAQLGVDALIVSNHGARNLDTVPATLEALPEVAARVAGRVPVLVDGGIRRGTDILKALALGAQAVLIGRPYVHGLVCEGAAGVTRVVTILRRELEMAMALSGRTRLGAIDRSVLW
jgi:4-hydroxymandelate oxidase